MSYREHARSIQSPGDPSRSLWWRDSVDAIVREMRESGRNRNVHESEARRACIRAGLDPLVTLSRTDCASGLLRARRKVAESGAGVVAIHTYDWDRQSLQPLFEMASAVMPCELRLVVVGDGQTSCSCRISPLARPRHDPCCLHELCMASNGGGAPIRTPSAGAGAYVGDVGSGPARRSCRVARRSEHG